MFPIGLPTSVRMRFNSPPAWTVNRRISNCAFTRTIGMFTLVRKFWRSLFVSASSSLRVESSSFTVVSSSLVDWSSSLAVSSSSLVLWSSSLLDWISSLAARSSSFATLYSSMVDSRYSRVSESSRSSSSLRSSAAVPAFFAGGAVSPLGSFPGPGSLNRIMNCCSNIPGSRNGMTSMEICLHFPSPRIRILSSRAVRSSFLALAMSLRSSPASAPRAMRRTSKLAGPCAGMRYGSVLPQNWRISIRSFTSTPGGANLESRILSASF
jgi:hypothetical protein